MSLLKKHILQQLSNQLISQDEAKSLLLELSANTQTSSNSKDREIAIIGMAGRFPRANSADEFWTNLANGVSCIDDFPSKRCKDFEPILRNPSYTEFLTGDSIRLEHIEEVQSKAGYLNQIDFFDADFFGIPPSEATYMDPHQRVALENAWQTLENAGYGGDKLIGSKTGVFIGKEGTNYSLYRYCSAKDPMQLTGSWESIMVSRINYLFNFRGPCMIVDTACSAGLVSVHMAAQSILNGECNQAIAGGINLSITGEFDSKYLGGMNMDSVESDEKTVRTFDAGANGTVWGEGIAFVMLKPLSKALADGDFVHAIIKGSAINNDGASNGLTAPNADAQEEVVIDAWEKAGINPETLSYIEAHGTGTVLGDPIEFKGLTNAFRRYTDKRQFCAIGSLKTNMGHLVAASGTASLFKVIRSIQAKSIAPTINFNNPNPYINFLSSPLYVSDQLQPWVQNEGPRRAALSSFGFSHTNCHMVIEEAPDRELGTATKPAYCFTLSAKKHELLLDYLDRYREFTSDNEWNLADLCFTANTGRGHYQHRLAIISTNKSEFKTQLDSAYRLLKNSPRSSDEELGIFHGSHTIVSDKKKQKNADEITATEQKEISTLAIDALIQYCASKQLESVIDLAKKYVRGGQVTWDDFYAGEKRGRLPLPTYPFEQRRYWAEPKITKVSSFDSRIHPLLDRKSTDQSFDSDDTRWVYESEFSNETHWVLTDHKIKNTGVVPGTTYLEMARAAIEDALAWQSLELKDLFFLQPMVVDAATQRNVRVELCQLSNEEIRFTIASSQTHSDDEAWVKHVEGNAKQTKPISEQQNIDELKQQANDFIETYQGESDTGVFQFGPHWDTVRSIWSIPQESAQHTLASLSLPVELQSELKDFSIHPSVLDNAMNVTSQDTGETYLPFMYKSFRFYRPFPAKMYSLIKPKSATTSQQETHTYDVILMDEVGNVIAEVTDYITKRVNSFDFSGAPQVNDFLELVWTPTTADKPSIHPEGKLLVLTKDSDDQEFVKKALKTVELKLAELPVCDSENDLEEYINQLISNDDLMREVTGIVLPDSLVSPRSSDYFLDSQSLDRECSSALYTQFHLFQALVRYKRSLPWGVALISRNAYAVNAETPVSHPMAAATHMFSLSAAMENSAVKCRILDIDKGTSADVFGAHLFAAQHGKINAIRDGVQYQKQLRPTYLAQSDASESAVQFKDGGVYLITGGLGGLGLSAAKYISEQSKSSHVILVGRSPLATRSEWEDLAVSGDIKKANLFTQLLALESNLSSLNYCAVDVGDESQVAEFVEQTNETIGEISGVLHTAGVAGDGFVMNKALATFSNVLQPKIKGTCNLVRAFKDKSLDFFVCYSSITALTGGEGQADYSAANAFMDALVPALKNRSLNFISINWPSWNDVGMALEYQVDDASTPFISLSADQALSKLGAILKSDVKQILPSDINRTLFAEIRELVPFTLSVELQSVIQEGPGTEESELDTDVDVYINGKSEEDLSQVEVTLAKIYGAVLGLQEIDVFTSFQDMGGNSIIATHLLKVIEKHFAGLVDISDIFSYPSVDEMAEYISSKMDEGDAASPGDGDEKHPRTSDQDAEVWGDVLEQALGDDSALDSLLERI